MTAILTLLTYLSFAYDNSDSLLDELLSGKWYDAIVGVYSFTMGSALFHSLIFIVGPTLLAIKYKSLSPVAMVLMITGTIFSVFFTDPTIQFILGIMGVLGFAGILYSVVHK